MKKEICLFFEFSESRWKVLGFGVANIENEHRPLATVPGLNTKRTPPTDIRLRSVQGWQG